MHIAADRINFNPQNMPLHYISFMQFNSANCVRQDWNRWPLLKTLMGMGADPTSLSVHGESPPQVTPEGFSC